MRTVTIRSLLLGLCLCMYASIQAQQAFLTPRLSDKLTKAGPNAYIRTLVTLKHQADITTLHEQLYKDERITPEQRSYEVITKLQNTANASQGNLKKLFQQAQATGEVKEFKAFWVVNMFYIDAQKDFIVSLLSQSDIMYMDLDGELKLDEVQHERIEELTKTSAAGAAEVGLCRVGVRPLWALGYTGCGRKVMNIDTGVEGTHPALSANYLGNNGSPNSQAWFDPMTSPFTATPTDCDGHGTHTMGIMCGLEAATNDTIGVAFGARWMAAQTICSSPHTSYSIQSFQWAMNPDNNSGTVTDRPDVINCSWYDPDVGNCDVTYQNLFTNVEAAGIAIVFSAGNSGSGVSTITNPKNISTTVTNTFCVANVNATSCTTNPTIASSSSRGPSLCGGTGSILIKPEVSAPGTNVRSAYVGGGYAFLTGTSMAAPHVAGAIALLKEAFPTLTGEQIKLALYNTCTDLGTAGEDNTYGKGLINIGAAYNSLKTSYPTRWNPPCSYKCGTGNILVGCSGVIEDGSGPAFPYAENSYCSWWIAASGSPANPITLTFDSLDLEYGYDSLYIYDGNSASYPLLAAFTGSTVPSSPVVSTGWDMFVVFKSDYIVNRKGFKANWTTKAVKPIITGPPSTCFGTAGILNVGNCTSCGYSYSWSTGATGTAIPATTTASYTVTAIAGCGSTTSDPFNFTINPLPKPNAGLDKTVCKGTSATIGTSPVAGLIYSWSPATALANANASSTTATPSTTTNYVLTAFNATTGCFGKDTVKVTVLSTPTANAGSDKTICSGNSTTIGASAVTNTTYTWSPTTGLSSSTVSNPTASPTATTTYILTATLTTTGCVKKDTVKVTVNPSPAANAGIDKSICGGTSTTIGSGSSVAGTTYTWSPTTALNNPYSLLPTASPTTTTTYILTAKTSLGCTKKDTMVLNVLSTPTANAGADKTICAGSSTSIGASAVAGTTYAWSPTTGLSSATVSNPTASPSTTTTYLLTATLTATGCTKTDNVVVFVNPLPVANAGVDKTICSGTSTTIGASSSPSTTYLWSPTTALSSSTVSSPTASPTTTTTYIVTATRNGCTKKDTVKVTVNSLPTANAGSDKSICVGTSTSIGTTAVAGVSYTWSPTTGLSASNVSNPTATPTSTTTYTVTATNAAGCSRNDAVLVTVKPLPVANAGTDKSTCAGTGVSIGSTSVAGQTYVWSPTTALSSSTVSNPTASPTVTTNYIVTATLNGCTKKDTVKVTALALPTANAGADKSILVGGSTTIGTAAVAGNTYLWSPATSLSSPTFAITTASPTTTTTYTVTVTATATGCTKSDAVVVTVTTTVNDAGTGNNTLELALDNEFSVYPNPVGDVLNIHSQRSMDGKAEIRLFNELGQQVLENVLNLNDEILDIRIPTSDLSKGVYFLRVLNGSKEYSYKLVKE